jgi:hypothetical protein
VAGVPPWFCPQLDDDVATNTTAAMHAANSPIRNLDVA